uniref:Secreted phosphoprotein 24 n=1 Tax=Bos indicus x Bos taurus TaxID=30522 RepID=A0A4W2GNE5_BOBOX
MEKMAMKMLVIFVLGMNHWTCTGKEPGDRGCLPLMMWLCLDPDPDSLCPCVPVYPGFPVYDYDPASLKEALSASVAKVNSQSLSPYLFRAFRSSVKRVNALDEDSLTMDLEFRIQETTCRRESEADPATCDFQRGYHVPVAVCRSTVRMSAEQVQNVWVRCHWSSSSGSSSSEEVCMGACTGVHRYAPHPSTGDRAAGPSGAWASVWTCRLTFIVPYFFQSHLSKILNTSLRKQ